jgi:integrase
MIRKTLTSLASLIEDARERGLVAVNSARQMRAGRKRGAEAQAHKRQMGRLRIGADVPTRAEVKAIVDGLHGRWRPIILTLVFSGLRSSELRGLRWRDVDLKNGVVHVRQRVDQYMQFGPPKSAAGERDVPMPPIVANALREWKLACPKGDLDLVFPTANGRPIGHTDLAVYGWQRAQIAVGVTDSSGDKARYPGLHAARHFFASWLVNSRKDGGLGLSAKAAQVRLGHSSITMTMDVYGHWFPGPDDHSELAAAEKELLG